MYLQLHKSGRKRKHLNVRILGNSNNRNICNLGNIGRYGKVKHQSSTVISLEAFAVTEFNEMFSGRQPLKDVKVFQRGCLAEHIS